MAYPIEDKLVIGVASSALFNLEESDRVYREQGVDSYRQYQRTNEKTVLEPGIAFPLIKHILELNDDTDRPVEVVLLSRNDPDTGLRVRNSIEFHGLDISRAAFVSGRNPFEYADAFNASLCLSANAADVERAAEAGVPAGCVLQTRFSDEDPKGELRIAFDFDGVIVDDSAEAFYQREGLEEFLVREQACAAEPMPLGPLHRFFSGVAKLQQREAKKKEKSVGYKPRVRIAIVTARNAPADARVVHCLRKWGIEVDEAFFLGGIEKSRILKLFKPHIFLDDQLGHVKAAAEFVPCAHVPFRSATLIAGSRQSIVLPRPVSKSMATPKEEDDVLAS
jgi:5'-nucleotidase